MAWTYAVPCMPSSAHPSLEPALCCLSIFLTAEELSICREGEYSQLVAPGDGHFHPQWVVLAHTSRRLPTPVLPFFLLVLSRYKTSKYTLQPDLHSVTRSYLPDSTVCYKQSFLLQEKLSFSNPSLLMFIKYVLPEVS